MRTNRNMTLTCVLAAIAAGCGGGGEYGGNSSNTSGNTTGTLNLSITDAAVDDVSAVVVQFTGVTLKPADGQQIEVTFDEPKDIDLFTLTDGATADLLSDTVVPSGSYEWVRLAVNAEFDNVMDSYAMRPTGMYEIRVPSGSQNGLKLVSGFTVLAEGSTNLVIDWDLRKSLSDPQGQPGLHLRPALRITDMAAYGTLAGTVAIEAVNDTAVCTNDLMLDTGNAVYLYEGVVDVPGDIGDSTTEPFATATVSQDDVGNYVYQANFLPVRDYSAVFTCQASNDDPDLDDEIVFSEVQTFDIKNGVTTEINF